MFRTIAVAALLSLTVSTVPAFADDQTSNNLVWGESVSSGGKALSRPAALPALYASYAALQVYDVYSTRQALARGAREANPLMQGVVGNQSSFWALKATSTLGAIMATERLWKTNKTAAIAVMVASNGVAAVVAARNARVLRTQR